VCFGEASTGCVVHLILELRFALGAFPHVGAVVAWTCTSSILLSSSELF